MAGARTGKTKARKPQLVRRRFPRYERARVELTPPAVRHLCHRGEDRLRPRRSTIPRPAGGKPHAMRSGPVAATDDECSLDERGEISPLLTCHCWRFIQYEATLLRISWGNRNAAHSIFGGSSCGQLAQMDPTGMREGRPSISPATKRVTAAGKLAKVGNVSLVGQGHTREAESSKPRERRSRTSRVPPARIGTEKAKGTADHTEVPGYLFTAENES
ncbi:MAG: hypothetical protein M1812_008440 [Candelaria pacifica]|nr:MAG: hypothetical protein M1812_008440 [Candelaria pacifica]